ncbi:DNA polymerase III subunit alpha [Bacteroidota bacterium]
MHEFVHLHNHTHYSLLDALCTPDDLINAAREDGQKAIAITDHGVMFGCFEFYKKAKKAGIKPIIGFEAYIANGSRHERIAGKSKTKKRNYFHLVLLAKNETGYKNLLKLTTLAHTEGFYYKPRIDKELLEKYHEGIIATSACIAGVVNAHLISGDYNEAYNAAKYYKELFGDDFYIELQNHNLPDDKIILLDAPKIASQLDIKVIATNDIHYLKDDHAYAHNVHLFIRDISSVNSDSVDIYKLRYRTPEMYFKTQAQMNELFYDNPEAIANTMEIADKCNLTIDTTRHMPKYDIPKASKAENLHEYLEELTYLGLQERYKEITPEIKERTEYELGVINEMDFPGYFLIVQDFIREAKKLGVRVGPGRGSAAGSIVAYALGITDIDPLPYDLLFERFLNPERKSMPDIDIDFADDKRDKIIDYVKRKYGENSVAQIITFGKLSTRAVLKDVGRVLGIHHTLINDINAKIPVFQGKVTPLAEALKLPDLRYLNQSDDDKQQELVKFSLLLEGKLRNTSVHAAGVVIAPGNVSDYVPLYKPPKLKGQSVEVVSQYSMTDLEDAGLLKMDFLGLRTLSIIDNTLEMIEKNHGKIIDIDKIDFEDEKTYDIIGEGLTLAVFQFESKGMQEYLKQLKPRNLEELTAMNALYRPGPINNIPEFIDRKHERSPIKYLHPLMEKSLKNTYGVIVYQEQVMQLARDIAGYTLGGADILRKAMGKKIASVMAEQKPKFIEGAEKNGINNKLANEIFDLIEKFASYGFNKSHSLAYSYLAYQTAWLKTHYPEEFLSANMTAEINDQTKIVDLIDEVKQFNIEVLPPDINRSHAAFTASGNKIFFGLAAIKNVGVHAVESIIKSREDKPFKSFFDFASRIDTRLVNKKALEALICSGAFDSLKSGHRAALFGAIESALDYARSVSDTRSEKMDSLFGGTGVETYIEPQLPDVRQWTEKETLEKEKEYLGFYISGHPLDRYKAYLDSLSTLPLSDVGSKLMGNTVRVCGILTDFKIRYDKKEQQYAFLTLEDFTGKEECIMWSSTYSKFGKYLNKDAIVMITGKADIRADRLNFIVDELHPIEKAAESLAKGYNIWLDKETNLNQLTELYKLCNSPDSKNALCFHINDFKNSVKKFYVADDVSISMNENTVNSLSNIFGRDRVRIIV